MKGSAKLAAGLGMARARVLGQQVPVAARVNLNNRCHSRCHYCSFWYTKTDEMSTDEWRSVIRGLARRGTKRLSISGGEPMLRKDLREIVQCAVDSGISPELNSTGFLFPRRKDTVRLLEFVKFSLDGSEPVHDTIRGRRGAFRELEEAVAVVKELGVKFSFVFTMTKQSLREIPFALDYAKGHGTFIAFHPVMAHEHSSDVVDETFPDVDDYRKAIDYLVDRKRADPDVLRNSLAGLEHVRAWPKINGLKCWAGDVFVMVEPNGDVIPCDRIEYDDPIPNCREHGIEWALDRLPQKNCAGCGFCGSVELNMLMAGRVDVVPTVMRLVRG